MTRTRRHADTNGHENGHEDTHRTGVHGARTQRTQRHAPHGCPLRADAKTRTARVVIEIEPASRDIEARTRRHAPHVTRTRRHADTNGHEDTHRTGVHRTDTKTRTARVSIERTRRHAPHGCPWRADATDAKTRTAQRTQRHAPHGCPLRADANARTQRHAPHGWSLKLNRHRVISNGHEDTHRTGVHRTDTKTRTARVSMARGRNGRKDTHRTGGH
jgi:hypothetical protein